MDIRNLDLSTPAGHRVLFALHNMRVSIVTEEETFEGVLSVPAVLHAHITLSLSDTEWKPARINRSLITAIHFISEN